MHPKAIAHVVAWKLNGATGAERLAQTRQIVQAFERARESVPGLLRMEIGPNVVEAPDAWDLALYMVFASRAELAAYQAHPEHLAIKQLVAPMRLSRAQVDFEIAV